MCMCDTQDWCSLVVMSKTLQVRAVPDDVHARLRSMAAAAGLSLSEFLLREIVEIARRPAISEVLRQASERSERAPSAAIVDAVRQGRDRDRGS